MKKLILIFILLFSSICYADTLQLVSAFKTDANLCKKLLEIDKIESRDIRLQIYRTVYNIVKNSNDYPYEYEYILQAILEKYDFDFNIYSEDHFKIVFTGSLGVGKSTIIDMLENEGYSVIHEVATDIINQEIKKEKQYQVVPWNGDEKRLNFQLNVAQHQAMLEQSNKYYLQFIDRAMPDGLVYLKHNGKNEDLLKPFRFMHDFVKTERYNLIFYFELLPRLINTEFRKEDDEFRHKIAPAFISIYENLGYKVIKVPVMSPLERLEFIKLFVPTHFFNTEIKNLTTHNMQSLLVRKYDYQFFNPYSRTASQRDLFLKIFESYDEIEWALDRKLFERWIQDFKNIHRKLLFDNNVYLYPKIIYGNESNTFNHIMWTLKIVDTLPLFEQTKQDLRIIMFFHDLGKAYVGQHEIVSEEICRETLQYLNFPETKINFYCNVIRHHSDLGMYPKQIGNINSLTNEELEMVAYASVCDTKQRKPFATDSNYKRIIDVYKAHRDKNYSEINNLTERIRLIDKTLSQLDFLWRPNILIFYYLKDVMYPVLNIKNAKFIKYAV